MLFRSSLFSFFPVTIIPTDTEPTPPKDKQPLPKAEIKETKEKNIINNVIQVDFTANKTVKAELKGEATKRQLHM